MGASLLFVLIAIGIIIFFLIQQKRQLLYIIERREMTNQFQKELLKTRLEAQEETLLKLSKDLHDNIGQLLSSSKMLIGITERSMPSSPDTLQLADETLSKAIHEIRMLNRSLTKDWLEKFNFIENFQEEIGSVNGTQDTQLIFNHPDQITLSGDRQLLLFRIAQEAFQNALRHGKPSKIKIDVSEWNSQLRLTINDDGIGFNTTDPAKGGLGIMNIKHRAEVMGGRVQWHSSNVGTSVEIELPILQE